MTYLGSITLPFRDFSYVVKIQCMEQGTTGIRDAVILDEKLASGEVTISEKSGTLEGWMQDPYDLTIVGGFARNKSEAEEYDARFPEHPLTRLRQLLGQIEETLQISDDVRGEPTFENVTEDKRKTRHDLDLSRDDGAETGIKKTVNVALKEMESELRNQKESFATFVSNRTTFSLIRCTIAFIVALVVTHYYPSAKWLWYLAAGFTVFSIGFVFFGYFLLGRKMNRLEDKIRTLRD